MLIAIVPAFAAENLRLNAKLGYTSDSCYYPKLHLEAPAFSAAGRGISRSSAYDAADEGSGV